MIDSITNCLLTGYNLDTPISLELNDKSDIEYYHIAVGNVRIDLPTVFEFINKGKFNHPILAGVCRNACENREQPPLITQNFIQNEVKNISIPKSFEEKARHLLQNLYKNGGREFKPFTFVSTRDYPLCYSEDQDEFKRIMGYLNHDYIFWDTEQDVRGGIKFFKGVRLSKKGIKEVEKDLPKIPLIGLVYQEITTGNLDVDTNINHAKTLFFQEPQTVERMRSACEALSFVLEPLRKDVKKYFSNDTETFFHLVNEFDIRHNKGHTKNLEHPEQLEWIFYSLLNTINTYTKMKNRIG